MSTPRKPASPPRKAVTLVPLPSTPADPLASLREAWGQDTGAVVTATPVRAVSVGLLETQEEQDALRSEIIVAWHADTVAMGFLHTGGQCGCRYLAGLALRTAAPVQAVR